MPWRWPAEHQTIYGRRSPAWSTSLVHWHFGATTTCQVCLFLCGFHFSVQSSTQAAVVASASAVPATSKCSNFRSRMHTISVCIAVLSCEICYGDHVKKVCPNLKNLHSTAIPCGYAVQGLGFFFCTCCRKSKSSFRW
jgi:hypothetical protein